MNMGNVCLVVVVASVLAYDRFPRLQPALLIVIGAATGVLLFDYFRHRFVSPPTSESDQ